MEQRLAFGHFGGWAKENFPFPISLSPPVAPSATKRLVISDGQSAGRAGALFLRIQRPFRSTISELLHLDGQTQVVPWFFFLFYLPLVLVQKQEEWAKEARA